MFNFDPNCIAKFRFDGQNPYSDFNSRTYFHA